MIHASVSDSFLNPSNLALGAEFRALEGVSITNPKPTDESVTDFSACQYISFPGISLLGIKSESDHFSFCDINDPIRRPLCGALRL